jgi:major membrane immunogen (membrane-anchored lipoprotein)
MKALNLILIAVAAVLLTACGSSEPNDEPVTVAPVPVNAPTAATETATPAPIPPSAKTEDSVQTHSPHINASAFLNALVESGCQIDKAEYKEVKRGGAIKIVCSKTVDALKVDLDDL